jgi:hypothetical protein
MFIVHFSSPAKDFDLTISSNEDGVFLHEYRSGYMDGSLYLGPFNWSKFLKSNTTYQWRLTANAAGPVIGNVSVSVSGEFTTAYCFIGETRHCYNGIPASTEGVGKCHGGTNACVMTDSGPQWDPSCAENTPYPWGDIAGNGIDDDCNGIVDDGEAYFCPVNDSTISQGCCVPVGSVFNRPGLSNIMSLPAAHPEARFLVKGSNAFVYYYSPDGKRYVFTNKDVIMSWFTSFDGGQLGDLVNVCNTVNELSDVELSSIPIGGNVTIRPGSYILTPAASSEMSKFETWYFVVSRGKVLRRILSGSVLDQLYPGGWKARVVTLPDAFFPNYTIGPDIVSASDYDPAAEWAAADMETEAEVKQ